MAKRRFRTAIPDSEWVITAQLTQGEDNHAVGPPIEMHYSDSYLAQNIATTEFLIGRRLEEAIPGLKKLAAKAKRKAKA